MAGVLLRHEGLRNADEQVDVQRDGRQQADDHQQRMAQCPVQRTPVDSQHPRLQAVAPLLQAAAWLLVLGFEPARAEHRRQGQRHQQGNHHRHGQGNGELTKQPLDDAAHEQDGDEHRHQRQVHRQQGEAYLAGAFERRRHRLLAVMDVPGDVLQHHDGIVHHQPGGDDQRHQRQVVQREPQQVHGGETADQRHRHRQRRNQRCAPTPEKRQHHQDHQAHGDQQGLLGLVQGGADYRRAIHRHFQLDAGWNHLAQRRQLGADVADGLQDIRPALPIDHQQHRFLVVVEAAVVAVLDAIGDRGHVAQAHGSAVLVADDHRQVIGGLGQLVAGLHLPAALLVLDRALGTQGIARGDGLAHFVQRDAVVIEQARLEGNPYRRQRTTTDLHLTHATNLGQFLRQDGRGHVVQLALVQRGTGQRQHHDRCLRWIDLAVAGHGAHAAGQQFARRIDRRLDLARGGVDVLVQVELDHDPRAALAAAAVHLADPGDRAERALQRRGHGGGHDLRAGPR